MAPLIELVQAVTYLPLLVLSIVCCVKRIQLNLLFDCLLHTIKFYVETCCEPPCQMPLKRPSLLYELLYHDLCFDVANAGILLVVFRMII